MALSTTEELEKTLYFLQEQNSVLKLESYSYKLRIQCLQEEFKIIKKTYVNNQAKFEQEGECINNRLMSKIKELQRENALLVQQCKQTEQSSLASNNQGMQGTLGLEQNLEENQKSLVEALKKKIKSLQAETLAKQCNLEQCQKEKIELEIILEQEQEAFVNRLWKQIDKLEGENRDLQLKLHQALTSTATPVTIPEETEINLTKDIQDLHAEVANLKTEFALIQQEHAEKIERTIMDGQEIRAENLKLKWNLQVQIDKREILRQYLTESERSIEIAEERHFNQMVSGVNITTETNPGPSNLLPSSSQMLMSRKPNTNRKVASRCSVCGAGTMIDLAFSTPSSANLPPPPDQQLRETESNQELDNPLHMLSGETEMPSDSTIEQEAIDGVNSEQIGGGNDEAIDGVNNESNI